MKKTLALGKKKKITKMNSASYSFLCVHRHVYVSVLFGPLLKQISHLLRFGSQHREVAAPPGFLLG